MGAVGAVGAAAPRVSVYLCWPLACEVSPLWTHKLLLVTRVSSITAARGPPLASITPCLFKRSPLWQLQ